MVKIWERIEDREGDEKPRVWQHQESEDVVKVEEFNNGTWDTFRNDTLVANFDTAEEAIKRGKNLITES